MLENETFNCWFDGEYGENLRTGGKKTDLYDFSDVKDAFEAGARSVSKSDQLEYANNRSFLRRVIYCLAEIFRHKFESDADRTFCINEIDTCRLLSKLDSENLEKQYEKDMEVLYGSSQKKKGKS